MLDFRSNPAGLAGVDPDKVGKPDTGYQIPDTKYF